MYRITLCSAILYIWLVCRYSTTQVTVLFTFFSSMDDPQIQQFAYQLKQKTEFSAVVNNLASDCWDQCITYTLGHLDSKQEKCITNCVQRFIDASKLFTQKISAQATQPKAKAPEGFGSALYN